MRTAPYSRRIGVLHRCWFLSLPLALSLAPLACSSDIGSGTPNLPSGHSGGASAAGAGAGATPANGGSAPISGGGSSSGGASSSGAGAAGAPISAGAGGASGAAGAPISAGAAGTSPGGGGSAGGNSSGADTPPTHPLAIDPAKALNKQLNFKATSLDPMAGTSKTDTHAGDTEYAVVDTRNKVQGKLVMTLGGIGGCCGQGGIGGFAVGLGFHHMAIAMQTAISSAPDVYKNVPEATRTDEQNRQMGDGRMEAWDGVDRVDWLDINVHDSFAYRAALGLKYMAEQDPGGDWSYFLNADGSVRWSDVYLVGYSFGSQTSAVVSKYVRLGRVVATSGPSDEGFPNATWIHAPSATPVERLYGLFGSSNLENFVPTTQAAGWLGQPVTVNSGAAAGSFGTPHLMILTGQGHSEFCAGDGGPWKALCQYAFGVTQ